jgi:hypothetical protein
MKNKSKLKKIQQGGSARSKMPSEWLYLVPAELTLRQIYELFDEQSPWNAEYWEEAQVLEIELPEAGSIDVEGMELDLGDEEGNAFLKEHQIQTVFAVTILPEDYEKAQEVMKRIVEQLGGFFCGDTEDFQPQIR